MQHLKNALVNKHKLVPTKEIQRSVTCHLGLLAAVLAVSLANTTSVIQGPLKTLNILYMLF